MKTEPDAVQRAGRRLAGMMRLGTEAQIREAEADLAAAYLDRWIDNAIEKEVDANTRRRLARKLTAGSDQ